MSDDIDKLYGLLQNFSTAMLVTHDGMANLRARPMAVAEVEKSCVIWFITSKESAKAHEIKNDTRVSVICQKDHSAYLSIAGTAWLVSDRAQIERVWKESFKVWFPLGRDDPDVALIRVAPLQAEYWDNRGLNKVQYCFGPLEAYLSGTRPHVPDGDLHGTMKL